jgi:hypothetical protein
LDLPAKILKRVQDDCAVVHPQSVNRRSPYHFICEAPIIKSGQDPSLSLRMTASWDRRHGFTNGRGRRWTMDHIQNSLFPAFILKFATAFFARKPMKASLQLADEILMIRPAAFGFNEITAGDNVFQSNDGNVPQKEIAERAVQEFDACVAQLREAGVKVLVFPDLDNPHTPDSVFPNNWITFHESNTIVLYPMFAPNRRIERRQDIVKFFLDRGSHHTLLDLTPNETHNRFLEGTGSMILDRNNRIVYACVSNRTDPGLFKEFCDKTGYEGFLFKAMAGDSEIYHTNVMMAIGEGFAVVCLDSIPDPSKRKALQQKLESTGHDVIPISMPQLHQFAGNMLQIRNTDGEPLLVMSKRAHDSLTAEQISRLEVYSRILVVPLDVIETYGGGSIRCMMAEVF